jgi:hypothetical protein
MNFRQLFPTPLGFDTIDGPWQALAHMMKFQDPYFGQTPGDLHTQDEWQELGNKLTASANEYAREVGWTTPVHISNMWLNRYEDFNSIHPHFHSNSIISCVMYIDSQSGTVFYRPQPLQMQPTDYTDSGYLYDDFRVDPTPNGVVFFPSSLRHTSIPQPGVRFTLSANFNAESYGSQSGLNQL